MEEANTLSGQVYILGIHPKKGGIVSSAYAKMESILIGAFLLELWQNGNIEFENKRIIIRNTNTKNKLHTFLLNKLSKKKKPQKISRWINRLYYSKKYIHSEVQKELVHKQIIRLERKRFLFFTWKRPVLINKKLAANLVIKVQNLISKENADYNDLLLLSLIQPAGLLQRIFPERAKRKKAKKQLSKMYAKNEVSVAVSNAIAAAQAVAASVAVSAVVVSASNS